MICCPYAYISSLAQLFPAYLSQLMVIWVTCWVKTMSFCHGWGCHSTQTASPIYLRHIQSDWAHWYAVHRHLVAALLSYTHPTWLGFWWSGALLEWKWCPWGHGWGCHSTQTASPIHLRDIYKVFEHIDMLHMVAASLSYTHPTWVRLWWYLGHHWSGNDVIRSWLRLSFYSNCFLYPY